MTWTYLLVIPAYFIGIIPFSVFVARLAGHDIYASGSGNPGASNVARIAGWRWGALAMTLDIAKGFVPTLLAVIYLPHVVSDEKARVIAYLIATAAMLGHVVPIGRKGGKGIATGGGAALALFPIPAVVAIIVWFVVMKVLKLPVVSSIIAAGVLTIWVGFDHQYLWEFIVIVLLFAFVVLRHIPNIRRLLKREENGVTKQGRDQYKEAQQARRQDI